MRSPVPLLLSILLVSSLYADDESSWRVLQSGSSSGPTPLSDRGIHGEGQTIAVLDTGLDWDNCYVAEPDGSPPPVNLFIGSRNVDRARRKVIAYDFLYSCEEWPGSPGCDDPANPRDWDNQGHGTHAAAAAAGDRFPFPGHDNADGVAPAAKLVIQDAGYAGGDACSQFPGLGCPLRDLRAVLQQAWDQGARIQSNEWGDRQGTPPIATPPTANYSVSAQQVDDFVWSHPEMVVVFNTGNAGQLGISSLSSPGSAKNTIQVGGVTWFKGIADASVVSYSGRGPTRDGRIKPDVVASASVLAGDSDFDTSTGACLLSVQGGTSWSSPTISGAAALVRQYYSDGYYPEGSAGAGRRFEPSAALVKATIIASANPVRFAGKSAAASVPSGEQGFGLPVLDDALYFAGDRRRLIVHDVPRTEGLRTGQTAQRTIITGGEEPLTAVLVWTDPPGIPRPVTDPTPELVNDLDLRLEDPAGVVHFGNEAAHPGQADRLNNVEMVKIDTPLSGKWRLSVSADAVRSAEAQGYALVITGSVAEPSRGRAVRR